MNDLNHVPWEAVEGISCSGEWIGAALRDLVEGRFTGEEEIELFTELSRDGMASTAGYAAIPFLLEGGTDCPRTRWLMVHTACLVIGAVGQRGSPPVPEMFRDNVGESSKRAAVKAVLHAVAEAEVGVAELLDSVAAVIELAGRADLARVIVGLALAEYGSRHF